MKKIMIILLFAVFTLTGCSNNNVTDNMNNGYNASGISTNIPVQNTTQNTITHNVIIEKVNSVPEPVEISSFTTKVHDHSPDRKTNVDITISKINGYTLEPGQTFSFCDLVGKSTPEKGYKKAKVFDAEGNLIDGYGGGNCQVSTTIYNAVKDLSGIEIVERHPHNNTVPYIAEGLDAAVSYGVEDLKFKNNNDYAIIINVSCTANDVSCSIMKSDPQ